MYIYTVYILIYIHPPTTLTWRVVILIHPPFQLTEERRDLSISSHVSVLITIYNIPHIQHIQHIQRIHSVTNSNDDREREKEREGEVYRYRERKREAEVFGYWKRKVVWASYREREGERKRKADIYFEYRAYIFKERQEIERGRATYYIDFIANAKSLWGRTPRIKNISHRYRYDGWGLMFVAVTRTWAQAKQQTDKLSWKKKELSRHFHFICPRFFKLVLPVGGGFTPKKKRKEGGGWFCFLA